MAMKAGLAKTAETLREDVDERYREAWQTLIRHSAMGKEVSEQDLQQAREILKEYQTQYDI